MRTRWQIPGAVLGIVALTAAAGACATNQAPEPPPKSAGASPASPTSSKGGPGVDPGPRSVVVTVHTAMTVEKVGSSEKAVRDMVEQHDGFVAHAEVRGSDESRTAEFEVRIPSAELKAFRKELAGVGHIDSEWEKTEDVTAPRADLQARLRNARAREDRLLALLDEQTGSLEDVIAVEDKLASVRGDIESMEAEKRVLDESVELATVHISLHPEHTTLWADPPAAIGSAFETGVLGARNMLVGAAVVGATVLPPFAVLLAGLVLMVLFVRTLVRWRRRSAGAA